jgi:hypothetical protein
MEPSLVGEVAGGGVEADNSQAARPIENNASTMKRIERLLAIFLLQKGNYLLALFSK